MSIKEVHIEILRFDFLRLHKENPVDFEQLIERQIRLRKLTHFFANYNWNLAKQPRNDLWDDDETAFIFIMQYLWLVESGFSFYINWIIYTLIKCDDFRIRIGKRNYPILEVNDLNYISLSNRLDIIEKNGFSSLATLIDTKIRNSIAHTNYDITNGYVSFYGRNGMKIDVKTKDELKRYLDDLHTVFKALNQKILLDIDRVRG